MLASEEIASICSAAHSLGYRLGHQLGHGPQSTTFHLRGTKQDKVLKVLRDSTSGGASQGFARYDGLKSLAPKVYARHNLGVMDLTVLERVRPLKEGQRLNELEQEQLLSLFYRLPAVGGHVHLDPQYGHLAFNQDGEGVVLDVASCVPRKNMSSQDALWASALQMGLFLDARQRQEGLDLENQDMFQEFASIVLDNRKRPHKKLHKSLSQLPSPSAEQLAPASSFGSKTALRAWAVARASEKAGVNNPNADLYAGNFLLSTLFRNRNIQNSTNQALAADAAALVAELQSSANRG
jgi:hypothetical protein